MGTVFPYIEHATKRHYSQLVLNPNANFDIESQAPILFNSDRYEHCAYVWANLISPAPA